MWEVFDGSDVEWQELLIIEEKSTYLHDIYWARHYQSLGWKPVKFIDDYIREEIKGAK